MKTVALIVVTIVCCGLALGAELRPKGPNCALKSPPDSAGEEMNHGITLKIFPRAKDIGPSYTGCQIMFAPYEKAWAIIAITEIEKGDPIRIWSEYEPQKCRYRHGKVIVGNPETCPAPQFLIHKSMAAGCVQIVREAVAQRGLGADRPQDCEYQ